MSPKCTQKQHCQGVIQRAMLRSPGGSLQKGLGLPATVFIIAILSAVVIAMSEMTEDSQIGFAQDFHASRAFYAAESGAQVALNRVFVGGAACSGALATINFATTNDGLNGCSAELECATDSVSGVNYLTFTSTAECGSGTELARRSIQVRAHQ